MTNTMYLAAKRARALHSLHHTIRISPGVTEDADLSLCVELPRLLTAERM